MGKGAPEDNSPAGSHDTLFVSWVLLDQFIAAGCSIRIGHAGSHDTLFVSWVLLDQFIVAGCSIRIGHVH